MPATNCGHPGIKRLFTAELTLMYAPPSSVAHFGHHSNIDGRPTTHRNGRAPARTRPQAICATSSPPTYAGASSMKPQPTLPPSRLLAPTSRVPGRWYELTHTLTPLGARQCGACMP